MKLEKYLQENNIKKKDFVRHIRRYNLCRGFNYTSLKRYLDGVITPPLKFILLTKKITNNQVDFNDWINKE